MEGKRLRPLSEIRLLMRPIRGGGVGGGGRAYPPWLFAVAEAAACRRSCLAVSSRLQFWR